MSRTISRRDALVIAAGALAAGMPGAGVAAPAPGEGERHGLSAFGELKYPPDFHHYDYVNPRAPKGGVFSHVGSRRQYNQNFLTFNTLNGFIIRGDGALGIELTFATLMRRATDEPDAVYGLAARAVQVSPDGLTYRFLMRPGATFHDGSPLTAHDVAFSLALLQGKGHPIIAQQLRDLAGVEAVDDATVVVRFAAGRARDVPLYVSTLPIFSRAYYATRKFDDSTLEVPLGSGAYKVGRFEAGRYLEYERVRDWWGADLPACRGQHNFDVVRYEYYRDRDVAFEGFTARNYLFREEFTARIWATRYDFPAVRDGRVRRETLPDETASGGQGWIMNTRRAKLKDPRVREALGWAFDFEWTNKTIMYGAYGRTHSVFQNSDMMAVGRPAPEELALLEPFRAQVPSEVFGEPFVPPVSDGSGQDRAMLRRATQLLQEAGLAVKDRMRVLPSGEPFTIEFLIDERSIEPHHMPFIKNLATIGVGASLRIVDPVQYRARLDDFDFDVTIERMSFEASPGESLRAYFSSPAASTKGSYNLAGMADPVIDALIDKVIASDSRPALVLACRALDRVMRAGRYWIPQWHRSIHPIAYWDVFEHPATKPRYILGAPETWWYSPDKAARIERSG